MTSIRARNIPACSASCIATKTKPILIAMTTRNTNIITRPRLLLVLAQLALALPRMLSMRNMAIGTGFTKTHPEDMPLR